MDFFPGWLTLLSDPESNRSFWQALHEILTLQDYNTRIVVLGTGLLGAASGLVGSFTLLRKRALMGDALSHAALPGIAMAYMLAVAAGYTGKSLSWLLLGATVSGLVGVGAIVLIRRWTRLKEDAALGTVLSVFFGLGVCLLAMIQKMESGHAAGLEAFIYGKTASMGLRDVQWIAGAATLCLITCLLFAKELTLLCFDDGYAGSEGYPVTLLDLMLMSLVVIICIVGLQAVGLILVIALLVIPAAAARFWTDRLWVMSGLSAAIGSISGLSGAAVSGLFARLPSGALIVLTCALLFLISLLCGRQKGLLVRWNRRRQLSHSIHRQHLLRAAYESLDWRTGNSPTHRELNIPVSQLLTQRSWTAKQLRRTIDRAAADGLLLRSDHGIQLTDLGFAMAERLTHQHRLWELYLIHYAEIAPSRVDRDADAIEHVLEPETIAELEKLLEKEDQQAPPESPHRLMFSDGQQDDGSNHPESERH